MIKVPIDMPCDCLECPFIINDKNYVYEGEGVYRRLSRCQFAPDEIEDPWKSTHEFYGYKEPWCPLEEVDEEEIDELRERVAELGELLRDPSRIGSSSYYTLGRF